MDFVDGVVIAVPEANRDAYLAASRGMAEMFLEFGALEVVDTWGADIPEGETTSFPLAVQRKDGETVTFGWIRWPSKAVRDAAWEKAMDDPRMAAVPGEIFDGRRMIYGGFDVIQSSRKGG